MRFSGHESFACRRGWLPKAYRALATDPRALADDEEAMVGLGIGKNMVRSLRFWLEVTGVATPIEGRGLELTEFAHALLGPYGHDPYLADTRSLWLLHWQLATHAQPSVFAWHYLLNQWHEPEFDRPSVLAGFARESERLGGRHSAVTLGQHLEVFLLSYAGSRSAGEDGLDALFAELDFVHRAGERRDSAGRREPVFAFRREPKPDLSPALFDYCLHDFWQARRPDEATLSVYDIALAPGSLGLVFQLPEAEVRARLDEYTASSDRPFSFVPSAGAPAVTRRAAGDDSPTASTLLAAVYAERSAHAYPA